MNLFRVTFNALTSVAKNVVHNFNAGPSILPPEVLQKVSAAILDFNQMGLSILEIGHRTPPFEQVVHRARTLVKELLQLDDDHEVLFLHGGATTQFMQMPMNLLDAGETVAIADTGVWSFKAIKEAANFGNVAIVCSSRDSNYDHIPKEFHVPATARYLHITTNNTIYGTQWQQMPSTSIPLVADMSSDIFSRRLNFNAFAAIYAGAQKNAGAAGATLVILNKNILGELKRTIPPIMDYRNHIEAKSMLNTPPMIAIYISMLTLEWLKEHGGVEAMEKLNRAKAGMLYEAIDESKVFRGTAAKEDRSNMNVVFVADSPQLEKEFLDFTTEKNIYGIRGHRSAGGFRASLYNALPMQSVEFLIDQIKEFDRRH